MPRKAIEIRLTTDQRNQLEKITRSHSAERRMVDRAIIILKCAESMQNQEIALELETSILRISKWRKRFAVKGMAGLEDEPRPGKPETYGKAFRDRLLAKLETDPQPGQSGLKALEIII